MLPLIDCQYLNLCIYTFRVRVIKLNTEYTINLSVIKSSGIAEILRSHVRRRKAAQQHGKATEAAAAEETPHKQLTVCLSSCLQSKHSIRTYRGQHIGKTDRGSCDLHGLN